MHPIFAGQYRKPAGIFGRMAADDMDTRHGYIYAAMERFADFGTDMDVLEIGPGSGTGLSRYLDTYGFRAVGIDFSGLMLRRAAKNNGKHLATGRLELVRGDFLRHDFSGATFDRIIFANVTYFWKDLAVPFAKLKRLLRNDSSRLVFYMSNRSRLEKHPVSRTNVFHRHDASDVCRILTACGFAGVEAHSIVDSSNESLIVTAGNG